MNSLRASMRLPPTFAGKRLCGSAPTIKNAPLYFVQPALHSARNYSPSAQELVRCSQTSL